jgi:hypothetical protein
MQSSRVRIEEILPCGTISQVSRLVTMLMLEHNEYTIFPSEDQDELSIQMYNWCSSMLVSHNDYRLMDPISCCDMIYISIEETFIPFVVVCDDESGMGCVYCNPRDEEKIREWLRNTIVHCHTNNFKVQ